MQNTPPGRALVSEDRDFDFEALYQGKPPNEAGFNLSIVPWDLGEPQPALVSLEKTGQLRSEILDAGCGQGENALFLAECGYLVCGFDYAPTAIEQARQRASTCGVDLELVVEDATRLEGLTQRFSTALDSGLYHTLVGQERTEYAAALHRVTLEGAQLHIFCFSDADSPGVGMPGRAGLDDLHMHLAGHWSIHGIEATQLTTTFTREFLEQQKTILSALEIEIAALRTDDRGRGTIPAWHLHATRR